MSSSSRGARPGAGSAKQKPGAKNASPKLNRAQLQAMEIRSAATVVEQHQGGTGTAIIETEDVAPIARRTSAPRATRKQVARPVLLTRAQEFAYVRADLRRLAITAGVLFAAMIIILFIVEG